jgi:hypothetical protein
MDILRDVTNNGEPKPHPLGDDAHDGSFEGSTKLYAEHLVNDHGFPEEVVAPYKGSVMQRDWLMLNAFHRTARLLDH